MQIQNTQNLSQNILINIYFFILLCYTEYKFDRNTMTNRKEGSNGDFYMLAGRQPDL